MKTTSIPSPINLNVIILALLIATIVFVAVTGKKIPVISNTRVAMVVILLLGMIMCTSGIGRVAATGQWSHPLSILGYVLGGLILLITLAVFVGWKLPYIHNDRQALLTIAILASLKLINAVTHYLLT